MIDRIIHDIRGALNNNLFFAALNCALTLPDICGKAEYPSEQSSKKRYIDWYDKEIGFLNDMGANVTVAFLNQYAAQ